VEDLKNRGVDARPRWEREGRLQEILFVDRGTRCVFQGTDLGRAYSAEGVQDRLASAMLRSRGFTKDIAPECQRVPVSEPEINVAIHRDPQVLPKATVKELLPASRQPAEPAPTLLPKKKSKKKRIPRT
jgi:hypothetical protein